MATEGSIPQLLMAGAARWKRGSVLWSSRKVAMSARVMLAAVGVAVAVLVFAPVAECLAHAGVLDDAFDAWMGQDGDLTPQSTWERFEVWQPHDGNIERKNNYGQVSGVWGCIHWPQLHGVYYHRIGSDITCGYLQVYPLPRPPNFEPDPGYTWACKDAPNVVVYSVPFNKGTCGEYRTEDVEADPDIFVPMAAQAAAATKAFNSLLAYYAGNDSATNVQEATALYRAKGYLYTDRELENEKMPEATRRKIMALLDKNERQKACQAYAEAVTKAEGIDSVSAATLRTTTEYLNLVSTTLPYGNTRGAFTMASLVLEGAGAAVVGGDKAYQTVINRYTSAWIDLRFAKHLSNSKVYAFYKGYNRVSNVESEWRRMVRLRDSRGDRIAVRTTRCEFSTRT